MDAWKRGITYLQTSRRLRISIFLPKAGRSPTSSRGTTTLAQQTGRFETCYRPSVSSFGPDPYHFLGPCFVGLHTWLAGSISRSALGGLDAVAYETRYGSGRIGTQAKVCAAHRDGITTRRLHRCRLKARSSILTLCLSAVESHPPATVSGISTVTPRNASIPPIILLRPRRLFPPPPWPPQWFPPTLPTITSTTTRSARVIHPRRRPQEHPA